MSSSLRPLLSYVAFSECIEQEDWLGSLEQYYNHVQNPEGFGTLLVISQDPIYSQFEKRLTYQQVPGSLLDPRLDMIGRLFKLFAESKQEKLFCSFFQEKKILCNLPQYFEMRLATTPLNQFLHSIQKLVDCLRVRQKIILECIDTVRYVKIAKKISKLHFNVRVIQLEKESLPELYVRGGLLGTGTLKNVYELISLTTKNRLAETHINKENTSVTALKCYQKALRENFNVAAIMNKKNGAKVVKTWWMTYDKQGGRNIMELCAGGTLGNYCNAYLPDLYTRMELALQLCQSLQNLHDHFICHLDIKIGNVLIKFIGDKAEVRLADFDSANWSQKDGKNCLLSGLVSTYPAPEMVAGHHKIQEALQALKLSGKFETMNKDAIAEVTAPLQIEITPKLDSWGLGGLLYWLKYGNSLYNKFKLSHEYVDDTQTPFLARVQECIAYLEKKLGASKDQIDTCIVQLLVLDAEKRMSVQTAVGSISLWLQNHKPD